MRDQLPISQDNRYYREQNLDKKDSAPVYAQPVKEDEKEPAKPEIIVIETEQPHQQEFVVMEEIPKTQSKMSWD